MNEINRIELRRSEVAGRLSELAGHESLSDGDRAEIKALTAENTDLEARWQAATVLERLDQAKAAPHPGAQARPADVVELRSRVNLANYVRASLEQRAVTGAEAEFNAAVIPNAEPGQIPLELLETRQTQTSDITGTGPVDASGATWRPVGPRVFNVPIIQHLGITMESIPSGQPVVPVATAGAAPTQVAEGADHTTIDDLTITIDTLQPKRLTAQMAYTGELAAMLPGIEGLLQRDLAQAFSDEMEQQILTGDGSGANVSGITHGVTQAANPGSATTYQQYSSLAATAVDGRWAGALSDVKIIMPVQAYVAGAALFETANTVDTALQMLMRNSGGVYASAHLPHGGTGRTTTSNCYGIRNRPMTTWAYCPTWDSFSVLRDPLTRASRGEVRLIATAYYNFNVIRADAIVALAVRIS